MVDFSKLKKTISTLLDHLHCKMYLSDSEVLKLRRLLAEIDIEVRGKNRGYYIQNRTRQIRLILNNARRREKELEAKAKRRGVQLSLFDE